MEPEVTERPCDRPDCGNFTTRSPSVLPLSLAANLDLGNGPHALCDDCASRWCFGPTCMDGGADGSSSILYRSLSKEQALKWQLDYDFIQARSSFGPRISVCGSCRKMGADAAKKALKEAFPGQYKCPVVGCDRYEP